MSLMKEKDFISFHYRSHGPLCLSSLLSSTSSDEQDAATTAFRCGGITPAEKQRPASVTSSLPKASLLVAGSCMILFQNSSAFRMFRETVSNHRRKLNGRR